MEEQIMRRRDFLRSLAAAGLTGPALLRAPVSASAPDALGQPLPGRKLGKTGQIVTLLGLGGYHIGWTSEKLAQQTIEAALAEGVRFFDTAESYGRGESETRYGKYLVPRYRDQVFIMTKTTARDAATARKHLEASLERLGTDRLDLWQIHSLRSVDDVDSRLEAGVLDVVTKARDQGKVRFIGFTGHASPAAHRRMIEKAGDGFDVCQMPINVLDAASDNSFIKSVLPRAGEQGYGVAAMKTLADGRFFANKQMGDRTIWTSDNPVVPDHLSIADCTHFAMSLPISVLITGAENPDLLREKARLTRQFSQLNEQERRAMIDRIADYAAAQKVEYYKA
jgi:aryl-alcohol dehydrogenase-like predicted oxidoreductase